MKQLDIYLMKFPFSDLSQSKVRPVLIISNNEYNSINQDSIVIPLTSNITNNKHTIIINTDDLYGGKLYESSSIRCDKIFTCHQTLLIKKIGNLKNKFLEKIINIVLNLIKIN